ncbi:MAG TPA: hypothetical protein VG734_24590 [Lacunisphaera sp.]|nr:hypothetical protein [Lacunisphaera sp.]
MTTLAIIDQVGGWWTGLNGAKQMFYGIGVVATLVTVLLGVLSVIGMDHHEGVDSPGLHHEGDGLGIFSVRPLTGFFLAFGWVGGIALDNGLPLFGAFICAVLAGGSVMGGVIAMYGAMMKLKSDGTMDVNQAVGAVGTVYVTVPAHKGAGGQVVVNFSGRQETLAALSGAAQPIASGEKVKVISIVDGRTVLVEAL